MTTHHWINTTFFADHPMEQCFFCGLVRNQMQDINPDEICPKRPDFEERSPIAGDMTKRVAFWLSEHMSDGRWTAESLAACAIVAMREPTEVMVDRAFHGSSFASAYREEIRHCWGVMIDEALK